jgi:hypothetical protein
VDEVNGAGDVGVDHAPDLFEFLIEEGTAEAAPCIRKQRIDGAPDPRRGFIKLVHALDGRKIGLQGLNNGAEATNFSRGSFDLWLVCRNQKIETIAGTALGQFQSNSGGGSGDDGELSADRHWQAPNDYDSLLRSKS